MKTNRKLMLLNIVIAKILEAYERQSKLGNNNIFFLVDNSLGLDSALVEKLQSRGFRAWREGAKFCVSWEEYV